MQLPEPYFTRGLKPAVFIFALVPLALLGWGLWQDTLGANPIEVVTRSLGEWALRFLLLTLLMSPLRRLGWPQALRLRRMLGLFAFFYATLHLSSYVVLDQFFDWEEIWLDILERPFITVGMLAFLMLLALAVTSPKAIMRKLGRYWQKLHWLIYPLSVLAILHFWWLADSKVQTDRPLIYTLLLGLLLAERVWRSIQRKTSPSKKSGSWMRT